MFRSLREYWMVAVGLVAATLLLGPPTTAAQNINADRLDGRSGVGCRTAGTARQNVYVATCKGGPRQGQLPRWAIGTVTDSNKLGGSAAVEYALDSEVPEIVRAGDGAGSGLDADLLDGQDSAAFAAVAHTHSGSDIASGTVAEARIDNAVARDNEVFGIVTKADGAGSGLDADLVDGRHANGLIRVGGAKTEANIDMPDCDPGVDYLPITFTAPAPGFAVVNASYTAYYKNSVGEVYAIIERTDPSLIVGMRMTASVEGQGDADIVSTTEVFPVGAGYNGFVLKVCDTSDSVGSNAIKGQITLVYTPFGLAG